MDAQLPVRCIPNSRRHPGKIAPVSHFRDARDPTEPLVARGAPEGFPGVFFRLRAPSAHGVALPKHIEAQGAGRSFEARELALPTT